MIKINVVNYRSMVGTLMNVIAHPQETISHTPKRELELNVEHFVHYEYGQAVRVWETAADPKNHSGVYLAAERMSDMDHFVVGYYTVSDGVLQDGKVKEEIFDGQFIGEAAKKVFEILGA